MPTLIAAGREADVFEAGPDVVRRRYRDGRSAAPEADVMRWLFSQGYPVPEVHDVDGADLVMARVEGPTMAESMLNGDLDPSAGGDLLSDLHDRLHGLPHPEAAASQCMAHLDLHPLNVLLSPDGPVVIDWSNARLAEPALDTALTVVILASAATILPPEVAELDPDKVRDQVTEFLSVFIHSVRHDPKPVLDEAVARRQADPKIGDDERSILDEAVAWALTL